MASSSNSPCAACKFLRRKCTQECVFAPYFPPDQPMKFANVHKVFGASNVSKILTDIPVALREEAVGSLAYEAESRLKDPVYGCVSIVAYLQQELKQLQTQLLTSRTELMNRFGSSSSSVVPLNSQPPHNQNMYPYPYQNPLNIPLYGMSSTEIVLPPEALAHAQQQQQIIESQNLAKAVAARQQQHEMMRLYEEQQQQQVQQHELVKINNGFDRALEATEANGVEFNQLRGAISSSIPLVPVDNLFQVQHPPQQEHLHQQQQYQHLQQSGLNDEDDQWIDFFNEPQRKGRLED